MRHREVDDGYVLCPECEGEGQREIQRCPSPHRPMSKCCGGHTAWVDCDRCDGDGQVEDDRPVCMHCEERFDEDKLDEAGLCLFCASHADEDDRFLSPAMKITRAPFELPPAPHVKVTEVVGSMEPINPNGEFPVYGVADFDVADLCPPESRPAEGKLTGPRGRFRVVCEFWPEEKP
jgi:hypothetical protein